MAFAPDFASQLLETYMLRNRPVFLRGGIGIGKSSLPKQIVARRNAAQLQMGSTDMWRLFDVRAALHDPVDIGGAPQIVDDETRWARPDWLPNEKKHGKYGILFFDELTNASPATQNACYQIVLDRKIRDWMLPDGWYVMAAGNRPKDKTGAHKLLKALANRFAHIEVEPSAEATRKHGLEMGWDPRLLGFLTSFKPELLYAPEQGDDYAFPTPRTWEDAMPYLDEQHRLELVSGCVGAPPAAELESFLRMFEHLPTVEEIAKNPMGVTAPGERDPALCFSIATAMVQRATEANIEPFFAYVGRLPREWQVMFGTYLFRKQPKLQRTKAFVLWASRNQDLNLA